MFNNQNTSKDSIISSSNSSSPSNILDELLNNSLTFEDVQIEDTLKSILNKYTLAKEKFENSNRKDRDWKSFLKVSDAIVEEFVPKYLQLIKILIGYDLEMNKKSDVELDQINKSLTLLKKLVKSEKDSR